MVDINWKSTSGNTPRREGVGRDSGAAGCDVRRVDQ